MFENEENELRGTRKMVYDYIQAHPGVHLREIARSLNLAIGDVQYHLYALEKAGYIISKRRGLFKHFYTSNAFNESQKNIIEALSHETQRRILFLMMRKSSISQGEIAKLVNVSASTVTWHMKHLVDAGLVRVHREGRMVKYDLKVPADEIKKLAKSYPLMFWEKWADRFADLWIDLSNYKENGVEQDDRRN
jgi:predicted transcriptional regulator